MPLAKTLRLFRSKKSQASLSPLMLLSLAACGGGGGSNETATKTVSGTVVKGPISNILVFADLNGDGMHSPNEPYDYTNDNGEYSIRSSQTIDTLVALGKSESLDRSSGASAENIRLVGDANGSIISPVSTLLYNEQLSESELKAALGLSDIEDIYTSPYDGTLSPENALRLEKLNHQIINVIEASETTLIGTGMADKEAFDTSIDALLLTLANASSAEKIVDLADSSFSSDMHQAILLQVSNQAQMIEGTAQQKLVSAIDAAIEVNKFVDKVDDLNSDAAHAAFSNGHLLSKQISDFVENDVSIKFLDEGYSLNQSLNLAPSNIHISNFELLDNSQNLYVGNISATDEGAVNFKLAGVDSEYFEISGDNKLILKNTADFEAKDEYSIFVVATDESGKESSQSFLLNVANLDPLIEITVDKQVLTNAVTAAEIDLALLGERILNFYRGEGGVSNVLSSLSFDNFDFNNLMISSQGISVVADNGYSIDLKINNFAPSDLLILLQNIQNFSESGLVEDLDISGQFQELLIRSGAEELVSLKLTDAGLIWTNYAASSDSADTFSINGSISSELSDYIDLLTIIQNLSQDIDLSDNLDLSDLSTQLNDQVPQLGEITGFSIFDQGNAIFELEMQQSETASSLEILVATTSNSHAITLETAQDQNLTISDDEILSTLTDFVNTGDVSSLLPAVSGQSITLDYSFNGAVALNAYIPDLSAILNLDDAEFSDLTGTTFSKPTQVNDVINISSVNDLVSVNVIGSSTADVAAALESSSDFSELIEIIMGSEIIA